jgi:hypothetical protein
MHVLPRPPEPRLGRYVIDMENITEDMLRFKEAVRHLWNTYFLEAGSPMSAELQESFEKIERELLRALVLTPSEMPGAADNYRRGPLPILLQAKAGLFDLPVQFGSVDANRNMTWEVPCAVPASVVSQYRFVEFFDWNPYGHIDLNYVKARAGDGRIALVEQAHCEFALESA